jgi:hypothetical protein
MGYGGGHISLHPWPDTRTMWNLRQHTEWGGGEFFLLSLQVTQTYHFSLQYTTLPCGPLTYFSLADSGSLVWLAKERWNELRCTSWEVAERLINLWEPHTSFRPWPVSLCLASCQHWSCEVCNQQAVTAGVETGSTKILSAYLAICIFHRQKSTTRNEKISCLFLGGG